MALIANLLEFVVLVVLLEGYKLIQWLICEKNNINLYEQKLFDRPTYQKPIITVVAFSVVVVVVAVVIVVVVGVVVAVVAVVIVVARVD